MNTIQNLFQQAQLAEAAYADLSGITASTTSDILKARLINAKPDGTYAFSPAQATDFVAHWQVIDQYDNSKYFGLTGTGFSATVFKNKDTGEYSLAIRGSQDVADFTADTRLITADGVAVTQVVDMYNYWQRLTHTGAYQVAKLTTQTAASTFLTGLYLGSGGDIPSELLNLFTGIQIPTTYDAARTFFANHGYIVEAGKVYTLEPDSSTNFYTDPADNRRLGIGILAGQSVNIDGHSLGGHLTMAFSRLFPGATNAAYGINGLGFKIGDVNVNNLFTALDNLSGAGDTGFVGGKIQNTYGIAGYEFAAMNNGVLQQPGGWNGIYIEDGIGHVGGHSATQMTDSLAVYNLFLSLDGTLAAKPVKDALAQLEPLFEKASNHADQSLESLVVGLSQSILGTTPTIVTDDREALYSPRRAQ